MAFPTIKNPNNQDWESHRAVLERLYSSEDNSMREVMSYMEREHHWHVKRNQYEKWLIRTWRLRKNVDSLKWKALYPHVRNIERRGMQAEVWIDGKKKSGATVDKETSRQLRSCPNLSTAAPQKLPEGVIVRAVSFTAMPFIDRDLPFHSFEPYVNRNLSTLTRQFQFNGTLRANRMESPDTVVRDLEKVVEEALRPVIPKDQAVGESFVISTMAPDAQFFISSLHRNILFSIANNFAGLEALPLRKVIGILQPQVIEKLCQVIRSAPHFYTSQSVALNLFRASIEVGDATTVNFLISEPLVDIQVNRFICSYHDMRFTPLERAASLLHKGVVKTLLHHGADVNYTHPNSNPFHPKGALNYVVMGIEVPSKAERLAELDPELFEMLLDAGGELEWNALKTLIKHDHNGDLVRSIISRHAARRHQAWSESGLFSLIVNHQNHNTSQAIFDVMLHYHMDLNFDVKIYEELIMGTRVIDVAAKRGDLDLMKLFLEAGVQLTGSTLSSAISSGNEDVVYFLLDYGAKPDCMESFGISPLAAAIRLQHQGITDRIIAHSGPASLSDPKIFRSALQAASEVGDPKWIEYLIGIGGGVRPEDLGTALLGTVRKGLVDLALMLIDAGADTNVYDFGSAVGSQGLLEALRLQNPVLVRAFLDADAKPNDPKGCFDDFSLYQPAIELAVRWGDINIVQEIIRAGADINACSRDVGTPALNIAIERKDYAMIGLLVQAGCDVNNYRARLLYATALSAGVKTGDPDMVRHLLSFGADPHDSYALAEVTQEHSMILKLLLHEHAIRYPKGRVGWCKGILKNAISCEDFPLFKMLLGGGADANQEVDSISPFGYAIIRSRAAGTKFVEFLLQQKRKTKCSPETIVSTTDGKTRGQPRVRATAFLAAIGIGSRIIVELLLKYNADVNFPAEFGVKRTPLQRATELGNVEFVQLLIEHGADVNSPAARRGGGTALQFAALKGYVPIARLLLENGADVDARGRQVNDKTALEGAAWQGRQEMVTVLLRAGAAHGGRDQEQMARAVSFAEESGHTTIVRLLRNYALNRTISDGQALYEELFDFDLYEAE